MCIVNHFSHADGNVTPLKESLILEELKEKSLPLIQLITKIKDIYVEIC